MCGPFGLNAGLAPDASGDVSRAAELTVDVLVSLRFVAFEPLGFLDRLMSLRGSLYRSLGSSPVSLRKQRRSMTASPLQMNHPHPALLHGYQVTAGALVVDPGHAVLPWDVVECAVDVRLSDDVT